MEVLRTVPPDRSCRAGTLDNPLRRWLAPAAREVDRLDLAPGQTVADLGTGVGFYLPEIARRIAPGWTIYSVDPDPENLEVARSRPVAGVRAVFLRGSAAQAPEIPDGSVDRVLLSLVLCCMWDKAGALDTAWRILRPGGRALVTYPRAMKIGSRRRALRVSAEQWGLLVRQHPWTQRPVDTGLILRRNLIERPRADEPAPARQP